MILRIPIVIRNLTKNKYLIKDCIVLKNTDGEVDTEFTLTFDEADICCFECVDDQEETRVSLE